LIVSMRNRFLSISRSHNRISRGFMLRRINVINLNSG
jgi:hypothetical protein